MTDGNQECRRSPLGLTFQDTIFQYSYKLLRALSPEYLLNFFLKCIYPGKSPDLWCSDLLESAVVSQIFTMSLQTKLSTRFLPSPPQAKGNYSTPSRHLLFSWNSVPPLSGKWGKDYGLILIRSGIAGNNPANIYLLKVNNRNTRKRYELCSKLIIKTSQRRNWCRSGVFIINFEHFYTFFLVFLLLTLSKQMLAGGI